MRAAWHHVLFTYDGTVNRLYLDGVQVASNTNAHQSATPTILTIGAEPQFNFNYLNGVEDDIRIYNRALSAMEVKQLYNLGAAKIGHSNDVALSIGLVGYWTFDGKDTNWSTGKAKDIFGNGNAARSDLCRPLARQRPAKSAKRSISTAVVITWRSRLRRLAVHPFLSLVGFTATTYL
jgi:Concanavalin A-like lectin/glucanases superfamily